MTSFDAEVFDATTFATHVASLGRPWRTRFAPAPTGWLHLGHVVNVVWVWGLARAYDGRVLLRIEDHDRGRSRPDYEKGILDDLEWLGLCPDEPGATLHRQSDHAARFAAALAPLEARGLVFACTCSRREIASASGDPASPALRYPGTCRDRAVPLEVTTARRVRVAPGMESVTDLRLGTQQQEPSEQCGDVLVRDRHGDWTYQWCVSVDDLTQEVDVVIRGEDLLASSGRQLLLARLLGRVAPPAFLHHPLLRHSDGAKLSKANRDTGIRELRGAGRSAAEVLGMAAHASGLVAVERPVEATDLHALFRA